MIIKKHRSIFIHIPKVAGQSVEHFFLNDLGVMKQEALHLLVGPNPDTTNGPPKLAHLLATDYTKYNHISQEDFDEYFKFAFVRNPWDRTISFYKYLGFQNFISFEKFIEDYFLTRIWNSYRFWFIRPQADYVTDENGKLLVDFIGKFESINEDFQTILNRLNLPATKLPYINKSKKSFHKKYHTFKRNPELLLKVFSKPDHHRHYRDYYTEKTKKLVAETYKKDIQLFNYTF
ncbi:MAG: sulfotransferase family 2 domain-containing protein [Bacteroidota bacterium]